MSEKCEHAWAGDALGLNIKCKLCGAPNPWAHALADPEPDRNTNQYQWLKWWYRQPENQERARQIERDYIATMQKDKNLD